MPLPLLFSHKSLSCCVTFLDLVVSLPRSHTHATTLHRCVHLATLFATVVSFTLWSVTSSPDKINVSPVAGSLEECKLIRR